ncbi:MAG: thiamine pyrophosphate-dependent dehydrogenase E1 component subunit alpha [Chloroflexi bacterium]|uniref:Pyruvate dehydrogenase (Acetyl-transferring) E1 component subunit alpha n=1 Tax=Candidatus Thermofonsia Clade 3 bacterium TaxID=2364212 RepID=A0A2M8QDW8_9CHLR|nr:thiamine pyrophosphate-dependent dehydrogenase E1 component subunit alpha [Candidatus Roseilinea sp. NK_OTU-006]PJF48003.1 MAG: pyruvate dehydrogenase (acetyl-transferring) E1 component subunit alpha [Candidatus Thermofonsia Clade 3 bacterium]RMG65072.1 MAG: thiamine pyrophosphate-dependent dehydrogenase E1 component subunit alpha [Chloroflexota bacterium]
MTLSTDRLLEWYRQLVLIRQFELRAIDERRQGLIPGFIHPYIGEEACAVGACAALNRDDVITSTHRGHGHLIAKGGDVRYMMAELAAREAGYCRGKGGSLHMTDFDLGILGANGIVAGGIPMAVGAALAFKMQAASTGAGLRVALAFFGDGATNEGAFHEALNLAGLWRLPVVFFCENNQYGEGTPQHKQAPVTQLSKRAESYAMPGVTVDGNDVLAVYEATQQAVERARRGDGPSFIEGVTYRYRGHYEGDPQVYRSREEVERWQARDPIPRFRRILVERGINEEQIEAVEGQVLALIEEAVAFARSAPPARIEDALSGVYGNHHNSLAF